MSDYVEILDEINSNLSRISARLQEIVNIIENWKVKA